MAERAGRFLLYWKAYYHNLIRKFPEQTITATMLIPPTIGILLYKLDWYSKQGDKPYYRGYYAVYRPDDPLVSYWRKPEEYPAPYLLPELKYAAGVQRD